MKPYLQSKKFVSVLLLCLLFCLGLAGCDSKKTVKIGFIGGLSGRVADLGIAGLDAVRMRIDEENEKGGINGRRIQLVIKDDQNDPQVGRQVVAELIGEGGEVIIGPMTSQMAMVITPILNEHRIPCVSPTVSTERLAGIDDYFLRVSSTARSNAAVSANYQIRSGSMTRVAAIYDVANRSYTENWLKNFKERFVEGGGEVVATLPYNTKENKPFGEISEKVLSYDIDGILIIANSMDSALLCQQIRKMNKSINITIADWGATEQLLEFGGKAVEGVTVGQVFDRGNTSPNYLAFKDAYLEQQDREPGFPGVLAYDAATVVITSLRAQKKGENLKQSLFSIRQFEGLQGPVIFDDHGDMLRTNTLMSMVRNRKFIVLE